ncbi:MAG TPA: efflux transporter outer membrane subunit [Candidatus Hydrogenedentes bacterium]|nr:efflux transporter outer membrane subunit [Candidatus Hydrogenedentota bacterium]
MPVRGWPRFLPRRLARLLILLAYFCIVLTSCLRLRPENRDPTSTLPDLDAFTLYDESAPAPDRWWTVFDSEELSTIVKAALEGNLTLQQIYARLTQAEALARQAGALRWPNLDVTGDIATTRRRVDTGKSPSADLGTVARDLNALNTAVFGPAGAAAGAYGALQSIASRLQAANALLEEPPPPAVTATTHSYRFGVSSGFEADLWGRVRARHEAALMDLEASREDVYAAMLSLSGAVVRQWLAITAQRQELELIARQRELNQTTLELIELRYRNGLATALDVFQQRQIVAQTESLVPLIESGLQAARHELAVLLGRTPQTDLALAAGALPAVGPLPEPGLPAELLARRPDVRAAGLQLRSADWRVAAARADRLPDLRLTAGASYGADTWTLIFDNWMATLAGSLTGPVFDAGRRKAEVARMRAAAEERLAAYRDRVLQSVKEVENALLRETKQVAYIEALRRELDAIRAVHEQARDRYRKGLNDYLPVLAALTQAQALERRLVQAEYDRLDQRARLCVALGGAWMEEELKGSGLRDQGPGIGDQVRAAVPITGGSEIDHD